MACKYIHKINSQNDMYSHDLPCNLALAPGYMDTQLNNIYRSAGGDQYEFKGYSSIYYKKTQSFSMGMYY